MIALRRIALLAALAAGSFGLAAPARAQCAMCRASIESSAEARRVSGELNRAILVLFAAPYLVVGTCTTLLFRRRIGAFLRKRTASRRA